MPGVPLSHDKAETLRLLDAAHADARAAVRLKARPFLTAQQVHGNQIAVIDTAPSGNFCFSRCDGLVTNQAHACLGIYVADCCAVYLADQKQRAVGLVHSGKKGTELGIVPAAIKVMQERFGVQPHDLILQLSPCIRPPHYEVDFAAEIVRQSHAAGAASVIDCQTCTACDLQKYYSYRAEKGKTGRMLALLGLSAANES